MYHLVVATLEYSTGILYRIGTISTISTAACRHRRHSASISDGLAAEDFEFLDARGPLAAAHSLSPAKQ
jgi:hypothetical protein